jgi:cytochrome c oxidase subunit 3
MMWWGTLGLMAIEGTVFALTIAVYFYLRSHASGWPMSAPPDLLWGIVNTVVMLASADPEPCTPSAPPNGSTAGRRSCGWSSACCSASCFLAVRGFEFGAQLPLGRQCLRLGGVDAAGPAHDPPVTDTYDTAVLTVLMFTGPLEGKRYVDVSENALYWYFVVLSWLPIYAVIYWGARL